MGTVPGTVPGVVRKACPKAFAAATRAAILRLLWRPIRVVMGEPISAVNLVPVRRATGRTNPVASRVVIAAVTRHVVREPVCRANCAALPAGPVETGGSGQRLRYFGPVATGVSAASAHSLTPPL